MRKRCAARRPEGLHRGAGIAQCERESTAVDRSDEIHRKHVRIDAIVDRDQHHRSWRYVEHLQMIHGPWRHVEVGRGAATAAQSQQALPGLRGGGQAAVTAGAYEMTGEARTRELESACR